MPSTELNITVNGNPVQRTVEDRTLLVHLLRDHLGLTGTHVGCDTTQCGACTIVMDGVAVKSCTILAVTARGADVTTVEGLAHGDELHAIQRAFNDKHGLQCGFCTPGMVMASVALIQRHGGEVDEALVREELEGNICRCTGYQTIVDAVLEAAETYRTNGGDW